MPADENRVHDGNAGESKAHKKIPSEGLLPLLIREQYIPDSWIHECERSELAAATVVMACRRATSLGPSPGVWFTSPRPSPRGVDRVLRCKSTIADSHSARALAEDG